MNAQEEGYEAHMAAIPPKEDWEAALRVLAWEVDDFKPDTDMRSIMQVVHDGVRRDMHGYLIPRKKDS